MSAEQLRMSQRTSPMVVISSAAGLLLSVGLSLLPHKLQIVLVPLGVLGLLMVARAILRAMGRVRRLARAGHRGAAVKDSFLLLIPMTPFFAGVLIMAIAIPMLEKARAQANEAAALATLRTINMAEVEYETTYVGYTCELSALAGKPENGVPTAEAADLIQSDLASGKHAGYTFAFTSCTRAAAAGKEPVTDYRMVATPDSGPRSGARGFCTDASGAILADPNGGKNCTEPVQ